MLIANILIGIGSFYMVYSCGENKKSIPKNTIKREIIAPPEKSNEESLEAMADSLYFNNNYNQAVKLYDKLINRDSLKGKYYFRRAVSNGEILRKKEAIKDYLKAIELDFRIDAAYFNLGITYSFYNDSLALIYYQKCLMVNPSHPKVKNEIIECKERLEFKKKYTI